MVKEQEEIIQTDYNLLFKQYREYVAQQLTWEKFYKENDVPFSNTDILNFTEWRNTLENRY